MRIEVIPCLKDNYAYLLVDDNNHCVVVDPSEATPVIEALKRADLALDAIWCTHHHWDHTGGNMELAAAFSSVEIVGHSSDRERIPGQNQFVDDGEEVSCGSLRARIIHNPGHTRGAISYYLEEHAAVFTGDTLFLAGCGRLFEGSAETMYNSLNLLARLPDDTMIYCGHEYTEANLQFALAAEPNNKLTKQRLLEVRTVRAQARSTMPGSIEQEKATNPFLRVTQPTLVKSVSANEDFAGSDPVQVFGALRAWKDRF